MRGLVLGVLGVIALVAPAIAAQDEVALLGAKLQQQTQPKPAPPPAVEAQQEKPRPNPPPHPSQLGNVRLEVTITDQRGSGQPTTKTISLVLADRANGRIRTTGEVRVAMQQPGGVVQNYQMRTVMLNVDAHPEFTRDGRVRAHVTLEYRPTGSDAVNDEQALTAISETFTVVLEDGKPLVVSQSADPNTDRRVRVEVKATILK